MRFSHTQVIIACSAIVTLALIPMARADQAAEATDAPSDATAPVRSAESPVPKTPASPKVSDQTGAEKTKRPVAAAIVPVGGSDGKVGNVLVTYADGSKDRWTKKGSATLPRVSADGTVGWAIMEAPVRPPGLSYELRPCRQIVVCNQGTVIATIRSALAFIEEWKFVEGQVLHLVVKSRQSHGPAKIELIAIPGCKVVSTVNAFEKNLPPWAKGLED